MRSKRDGDESVSSENTLARVHAAGASIAGVVSGAGGNPVTGALVSLSSDAGTSDIAQQTADDGTFRFGHLAPGKYVVHVGGEAKKTVNVREAREYYVKV